MSRYGTCKMEYCAADANVDVKLYPHRIMSTLAERSV